jgi:N-acetylmuramoyl-L-alanine amidase
MYLSNTLCRNILCSLLLAASLEAQTSDTSGIVVVYPKPGQTVTATDSTFILGHLTRSLLKMVPANATIKSALTLKINGHPVKVHSGGGFLAFLPVTRGDFTFELKVTGGGKHAAMTTLAELSVPVVVGSIEPVFSKDSLVIMGDFKPPSGDIAISTGDRLDVRFRGSSGGTAWFSISGVVDSVPMSEVSPSGSPYWGEAVFGEGVVPEAVPADGVYSGFINIAATAKVSAAEINYSLCRIDSASKKNRCTTGKSGYKVSLNSDQFPFTVQMIDSTQTMRVGPRLGYFSIFQPKGVEVLAVGAEGEWYRVQLSATQFAWVAKASVERLNPGLLPPTSIISSVRTYDSGNSVTLAFPLSGKHAYRIVEESSRKLTLQLFGVTSNTDWIRSEYKTRFIDYCTWLQREAQLYEFTINLRQALWGYDCYYEGNTLRLKVRRPPTSPQSLKGKTIVVDPGHSADPGSIGPTGFTEAEANLGIALALRDDLTAKGATVVMTRSDMSHVALADRPAIAKNANADLFISVHNNSLPDGVNPFTNNGTSVIYYHPWSKDLARSVLGELLKVTGLPDHGLYWGNLAVNRPTQYPAILVECDFMILPERETLLKSPKYQKQLAGAIATGIVNYLKGYPNGR